MASVHRRPGSPYWHAAWRDVHGKLIFRSTKLTERSKALTAALEYERAEKLGGAGSLVEAQARQILSSILERCSPTETLRNVSTGDWLREWLATKVALKSTATGVRYGQIIKEFIIALGDRAKKPLSAIAPRDIQSFLAKRTTAGCGPTTVQLDGKILRTAFNRARREGLISTNPTEAIELPQRRSIERGTFTPTEVKLLIDHAVGEWKTLILLGYFSGARLGDCCRLEWRSVDLAKGLICFTATKTGKPVTIPIHPDLANHLESLATSDHAQKFVMPGMADRGPGGAHGLSERFKRIVEKAGLDLQQVLAANKRKMSKRTFHALRHSFTSALANANVAPEVRMLLTGHSTQASHKVYSHHEIETLRSAVNLLPSLKAK